MQKLLLLLLCTQQLMCMGSLPQPKKVDTSSLDGFLNTAPQEVCTKIFMLIADQPTRLICTHATKCAMPIAPTHTRPSHNVLIEAAFAGPQRFNRNPDAPFAPAAAVPATPASLRQEPRSTMLIYHTPTHAVAQIPGWPSERWHSAIFTADNIVCLIRKQHDLEYLEGPTAQKKDTMMLFEITHDGLRHKKNLPIVQDLFPLVAATPTGKQLLAHCTSDNFDPLSSTQINEQTIYNLTTGASTSITTINPQTVRLNNDTFYSVEAHQNYLTHRLHCATTGTLLKEKTIPYIHPDATWITPGTPVRFLSNRFVMSSIPSALNEQTNLSLWDTATGSPVELPLNHHGKMFYNSTPIVIIGNRFIVSNAQRIFDAKTGNTIPYEGTYLPATENKSTQYGCFCTTTDETTTNVVRDLATQKTLFEFEGTPIDFDDILLTTADEKTRVYEISSGTLLAHGFSLNERPLLTIETGPHGARMLRQVTRDITLPYPMKNPKTGLLPTTLVSHNRRYLLEDSQYHIDTDTYAPITVYDLKTGKRTDAQLPATVFFRSYDLYENYFVLWCYANNIPGGYANNIPGVRHIPNPLEPPSCFLYNAATKELTSLACVENFAQVCITENSIVWLDAQGTCWQKNLDADTFREGAQKGYTLDQIELYRTIETTEEKIIAPEKLKNHPSFKQLDAIDQRWLLGIVRQDRREQQKKIARLSALRAAQELKKLPDNHA